MSKVIRLFGGEPSKVWRLDASTCSICDKRYSGFGNNALPINAGRCCDECNANVVLPARIRNIKQGKPPQGENP